MRPTILLIAALLLIFGCAALPGPAAEEGVPAKCEGLTDCNLFSCMESICWCKDAPDSGALARLGKQITSEDGAKAGVASYLESRGMSPAEIRAVKLNSMFYNVFYKIGGEEHALTISSDGTIMETACGV